VSVSGHNSPLLSIEPNSRRGSTAAIWGGPVNVSSRLSRNRCLPRTTAVYGSNLFPARSAKTIQAPITTAATVSATGPSACAAAPGRIAPRDAARSPPLGCAARMREPPRHSNGALDLVLVPFPALVPNFSQHTRIRNQGAPNHKLWILRGARFGYYAGCKGGHESRRNPRVRHRGSGIRTLGPSRKEAAFSASHHAKVVDDHPSAFQIGEHSIRPQGIT
jgi:hypothetical protein